ncbi:MAG: RdgB/HAM1 family non-canonical purine NTP pyrophosphatase [Alphaproteobacteria bacterium]|nr:RdgB/HAM1 family non-canonical purine NTP pyrophosphatase [Alphaproteobacteria bacterium]
MNKLILATHNAHKLEEVRAILAPLGVQVLGAADVGLKDVAETGTSFQENALLKARAAYEQVKMPVLADDSGLCIAALDGRPGIYSARFATEHGGYPAVFDEIWKQMGNNPDRTAYFICCMALVTGDRIDDYHLFTGKMSGKIDDHASGTHLFGYDPIFIPDGYTQTCGVLEPIVKNKISHRAKALSALVTYLGQA